MSRKHIAIIQAKEFDASVLTILFDKYKDELRCDLIEHLTLETPETSSHTPNYKLEYADKIRQLTNKDLHLDAIILVSLSAENYHSEFQSISDVPIVSLFELMAGFLPDIYPCINRIGVLKSKESFKPASLRTLKKKYQLRFITKEQEQTLINTEADHNETEATLINICENFIEHEVDLIIPGLDSIMSYSHVLKYEFPLANPLKTLFKQMNIILDIEKVEKNPTLGIIGGMGPLATVDFIEKIIRNTSAEKDQDHVKIKVEHCPDIPDRTKSILGEGDDAVFKMYQAAKNLEDAGVSAIAVPCNTAHFFINQFKDRLSVPIIHIIDETIKHIKSLENSNDKVALLATKGSIKSQIYSDAFQEQAPNMDLYIPSLEQQDVIMQVVHGIKSQSIIDRDAHRKAFEPILQAFADKGVTMFILGCTELPLIFEHNERLEIRDKEISFIDPTILLAKATVRIK